MNNYPENDNKDISESQAVEENVDEVFSTVFSNPTVHRDIPQKKKHRLLAAIASVLAVAIFAGGTVAVIKLIPEKEENIDSPFISDITVTEVSSDEISKVTVKNEKGTLELYTEKTKSESSSSTTSSESEETVTWYLKGVDKKLVNSSTISSFAQSAASITAMREITEKTQEDCGFNKPFAIVDIKGDEKNSFTVTGGGKAPDGSGYYVKNSKDNKIYLVDSSYAEELNVDSLYFATSDSMSAFAVPEDAEGYVSEEGAITTFDSLTIKSKKFSDTLVIESNPNEALAQYAGFMVKKPTVRVAENVDGIVSLFASGVSTVGAYSYDVSAESIKRFGLDTPDFQMTLDIMGKTLTYKFALQNDGNYAAINDDSKLISTVGADAISTFANADIIYFYSSWICLYSIDDINALNLTVNGKNYNFGIKKLSEEEAEESDVNYAITLNGKEADCQSFQNIYQFLISLACTDYTVDKAEGEPQITFEFVFKDKKVGKSVVEFTKSGETRYQYSVDGMNLGKINSSAMNKLVKYLEKFAAGETIPNIN